MWLPSHSSLSGVHATHCSRCVFLPSSRLGSASAAADVVAREAALSGRRDLLYSNYLARGRALDYGAVDGGRKINYSKVIKEGIAKDGYSAFFTPAKWFTRVLMNAPAQGTIPWFYNQL